MKGGYDNIAAINATLVCQGLRTGKNYFVDVYAPDAVSTLFTFNPAGNAVATSNSSWRAPEDIILKDISATAGPTATSFTWTADGAVLAGGVCRWANQLTSLPQRISLNIPIKAGSFLGALQA